MSEESGLMLEIAPQRTSLVLLLRRAQIVYVTGPAKRDQVGT